MQKKVNNSLFLFLAICGYFMIPFLYQSVRTSLVASIPSVDGLGIAGHMEWFDLINETIQAFLLVPLYHLFSTVNKAPGKLKGRVHTGFVVSTGLYLGFSMVILIYCSSITTFMTGAGNTAVTSYLWWETVAFIIGHISSFAVIVFVIIGKPLYIVLLTAGKRLPLFWPTYC